MKQLLLYTCTLAAFLSLYSCRRTMECWGSGPSYLVVCSKNADTVSYYVPALLGQNTEARDYYESNGYTCTETPSYGSAPGPYVTGYYSPKELEELERMGYKCDPKGYE